METDNEIDSSGTGSKTTNIYMQNPVNNGYYKVSEKNIILKSGCYESPPGYKKAEWFADEVIKKGKKGFLH